MISMALLRRVLAVENHRFSVIFYTGSVYLFIFTFEFFIFIRGMCDVLAEHTKVRQKSLGESAKKVRRVLTHGIFGYQSGKKCC